MKYKSPIRLLAFALLLYAIHPYFSCKKIDIKREVLITSAQAQNITFNSAVLHGQLVDIGEDGSITEYGFAYGSTSLPTPENNKVVAPGSPQQGDFSLSLQGLESNMQYYFRAYAVEQSNKVTYGNTQSLKTEINPDAEAPDVSTLEVFNISPWSAMIKGMVDDDGGATIMRKGFCLSNDPLPTIADDTVSENSTDLGEYLLNFTNLIPETEYFVRAYARNKIGIGYGEVLNFTTPEAGDPVNEWLHYDDGENFDGIGLTEGGSFDVAIRFSPDQLAPYNGMKITKVKFFPKGGMSVNYFIEILTGSNPKIQDLEYEQYVDSLLIDEWNELSLDTLYFIDASKDLWVGYLIYNQPAGVFPAGIDEGPAESGFGDMISLDNLESWESLSDAGINANWNIQVFVSNQSGEEIPMTRAKPPKALRNQESHAASATLSSKRKME